MNRDTCYYLSSFRENETGDRVLPDSYAIVKSWGAEVWVRVNCNAPEG